MRIDLHCHTKKSVQGDDNTRLVTKEKFRSVIEKEELKVVAITNHNEFDITQYVEFSRAVSDMCQIWPGVELTVKTSDSTGHLIIVCDPDYRIVFSEKLQLIFKGNKPDQVMVALDELGNLFDPLRVIYIAHYYGKDGELQDTDIAQLKNILSRDDILFLEPSNATSMGILLNHEYKAIIGSDVKDWDKYPSNKIPELRFKVSTFSSFRLLAKRDVKTVKSLLTSSGEIMVPVGSYWNVPFILYKDINVIYGGKGTGKTELLKEIRDNIQATGNYKVRYFNSTENTKQFADLQKITFSGDELSLFSDIDFSTEISSIVNWQVPPPTKISDYILWKESDNIEELTKIFGFIGSVVPSLPDSTKYTEAVSAYIKLTKVRVDIVSLNIEKYAGDDKSNSLIELVDEILSDMIRFVENEFIVYYSDYLINKTIEIMKKQIEMKKEIKTKPQNTGLSSLFVQHNNMVVSLGRISNLFSKPSKPTFQKIGLINYKGTVYLRTDYYINPNEATEVKYNSDLTVSKIKAFVKAVSQAEKSGFTSTFASNIKDVKDYITREKIKNLNNVV